MRGTGGKRHQQKCRKTYKNPDDNLVTLTELLSHITPTDTEKYLAIFASKNAAAHERIMLPPVEGRALR